MDAAVSNRNSVMQTFLDTRSEIFEAPEAGLNVRLGTVVLGLFPQRPTAGWINGGLADDQYAWLLRFKQVMIAA